MTRHLLASLAMLSLGACGQPTALQDGEVGEAEGAALWRPDGPAIPLYAEALITFDTTPTGAAIANGTAVDTVYASMGVTFSCTGCGPSGGTGSAFARASSATNNAVGPAGGWAVFDERVGVVRAEFASPRRFVSLEATRVLSAEDLTGQSSARPWLQALDVNGNVLFTTYWTIGGAMTQVLLVGSNTNAANIKAVRFSSEYRSPPGYGIFDNFRFHSDERPRGRL